MPRPSWKGYLRLSLVSVPVEAINAIASDEPEVTLHQLHSKCLSRIRYKKICPIHGEVPNDEIVLGHEREKGQYVVVEKDEVSDIKRKTEKAIQIDTFVSPHDVDPLQFEGRAYYLLPDGPVGQKPYAVLLRALATSGQIGIGQAALFGRQRLVAVRPMKNVLCLEMLYFPHQVQSPESIIGDVSLASVSKEELKLATTLIEASTAKKFDMSRYEDEYTAKLKELIESKAAEEPEVSGGAEKEPPLINLMDALRRSVAKQNRTRGGRRRLPSTKPIATHRRSGASRRAS